MNDASTQQLPWYRQFWPWFLIAIPMSAVIGGGIVLWLALSNPDYLVVEEEDYNRIRSELKAQQLPARERPENSAPEHDQD